MDGSSDTDAHVTIISSKQTDGFTYICQNPECAQVLAEGNYVVVIDIDSHRYIVGNPKPRLCCGATDAVPLIFTSMREARSIVSTIVACMNRDKSTKSFTLLDFDAFNEDTPQDKKHAMH